MTDFNQQIIEEFRANQGRVGGMFEGGLHHHHAAESGELFPYLRDRYPHLDAVLDRLYEEHAKLASLLDDLQERISSDATDPAVLLTDVDRLIAEIEAHLAYEEHQLLAILNALPPAESSNSG